MEAARPLLKTEWIDPVTRTKGYLVIDKLVGNLCAGGIRMRKGLSETEVIRLAQTMSFKLSTLGMACGGSKAGIDYDPNFPDALDVLRRFLEAHRPFLRDYWATSEDLGTKAEDISKIAQEMGLESSFVAAVSKTKSPEATQTKVLKVYSLMIDGMPVGDVATGYGVAVSVQTACAVLGLNIRMKAAVQGFGSVGASAAMYLDRMGCQIVAVADAEGTVYKESGLDIGKLLSSRSKLGIIDRSKLENDHELLPREEWLGFNVDVLVPAAVADTIHTENVNRIKAKLIVEGANIPTTAAAEAELTRNGVYIIPDFVANAGGVGLLGVILDPAVEPTEQGIFAYLAGKIGTKTGTLLQEAIAGGQSVREIALKSQP